MSTYTIPVYAMGQPIGSFQIIQNTRSFSASAYTLNFIKNDSSVISNIPVVGIIANGTNTIYGSLPLANNNLKLNFKTTTSNAAQADYDWFNTLLANNSCFPVREGLSWPNTQNGPIEQTTKITYQLDINPTVTSSTIRLLYTQNGTSYILDLPSPDNASGPLTLGALSLISNSNTCFLSGTPVVTDQGQIAIDRINPSVHTIRYKKIVAITQTVTDDSCLIQLDKHVIANNVPSHDTIISRFHKVLYKGQMICAKDVPSAKKIAYEGQLLYNVLLEDYEKMVVNNLIVDTLHPRNRLAILSRYIIKNKPDAAKANKLVAIHNRC